MRLSLVSGDGLGDGIVRTLGGEGRSSVNRTWHGICPFASIGVGFGTKRAAADGGEGVGSWECGWWCVLRC
jgi:hypothetical protein